MNIVSVKDFETNYLVNDSVSIPKDSNNKDCRKVEEWLKTNLLTPRYTLEELKELKKKEIRKLRDSKFSEKILVKNIAGKDYYAATNPEINIFQAATLMADSETRDWGCYCDGNKELVTLSKDELLSLARHYEQRKNTEYNLCDKRRAAIDAMTTIEEVEAYDITTVYS